MYLKSLEVHGFKSFANKMLFEFHNGITAIVGPNGSGKSNVADAVRWVLGEQSAKQLRGAKMEDVIFAGTQLRKPLGYAYVAITISNEDHKLNVPYEEVKIARRVYRSGESEYLLNGASCRLKDVQELLFDTGIGKEGYSIIGQGQIDKILSGKPEERRELFDEAAGIVKYKKRKAAAEKNLEEEQQNLTRIEDILSELDKQVGPLEQQAQKAKEYLMYRDELRNLDIHLFLHEYDTIHNELNLLEEKQGIAARDLQAAQAACEQIKEEYVAVETQLEEHNKGLEQQKELLSANRMALNQSEGQIKVLHEQILAVRQNKEHNHEQIASLQERISRARKEQAVYLEQKKEAESIQKQLEQEEKAAATEAEAVRERIVSMEKEMEQCSKEVLAVLNENTTVKSEQQRMETLLEQNKIKKAEITKKVLENKTEASVLQEVLEKEKAALQDISDKLQAVDDMMQEVQKAVLETEKKQDNLLREQQTQQQQYHMQHSRLTSLRNLTERYEGYGQSIKKVMEQKQKNKGIVGVVADIIRVKKQYEVAVETALGGSIQNIVTDNEQTAKAMIAYLKQNRYGRATFLPLTNMKAKPVNVSGGLMEEPGVIGIASALVDADEKYSNLVEYLLGRFIVVDHIDHAISLAKKYHHTIRIVTTEGDLLNPGGSMSGGAFKNNHNLLGRRREMEDLEKSIAVCKEQLKIISGEIEKKQKEQADNQSKLSNHVRLKQELSLKQNTAKINYDRAAADMEKNMEKLEIIRLESSEIETKKDDLCEEIEKINRRMQENEEQGNTCQQRVDELAALLEKEKDVQEQIAKKESEIVLEKTTQTQSIQFIFENLERVNQTLQQLSEELKTVSKNGEEADSKVIEKEAEIAQQKQQMAELEEFIQTLEEKIDVSVKKREELNQSYKGFFEKREELSNQRNALDKECYRLSNQKEKLTEKQDSHINYMWEQYELTYHSAKECLVPVEVPDAQIKGEIGSLKQKMKALGDVNVNAVEQYKEVQERYELLHGQHDDLIEAANVLKGIIQELDEEMRKQFESQFAEIRSRFDSVFKELFGGGRGTLELTEDADILQAGIRIVAQPPGKKLQNMMQLSGGEKALTAIALLFAIQSLKPSPFCLLDEIEAALDDSNVSRYAEYLHKLTKDTQFIVITHRRGTMNAADILYGITMQEKGVSALVSVNLLDEKEIAN